MNKRMTGKIVFLHTIDDVTYHKEFDSISEMIKFVEKELIK